MADPQPVAGVFEQHPHVRAGERFRGDGDRAFVLDEKKPLAGNRGQHRAVAAAQQRSDALLWPQRTIVRDDQRGQAIPADPAQSTAFGADEDAAGLLFANRVDDGARESAETTEPHLKRTRLEPRDARASRSHEHVALTILEDARDLGGQRFRTRAHRQDAPIGHPDAQTGVRATDPEIAVKVFEQFHVVVAKSFRARMRHERFFAHVSSQFPRRRNPQAPLAGGRNSLDE